MTYLRRAWGVGALAAAVALTAPFQAQAQAQVDLSGTWSSLQRTVPEGLATGAPITLRNTDWAPLSAGAPESREGPVYEKQLAIWEDLLRNDKDIFQYFASVAYKPTLKPAGVEAQAAQRAATAGTAPNPFTRCLPRNQIGVTNAFMLLNGQDRIVLIGGDANFRVIHLDGRDPAAEVPTTAGTSIGKWQGDRLVVTTNNFLGDTANSWPMSDVAKVTETFWLSPDRNMLNIKTVYEDAKFLAEPLAKMTYVDRKPKDFQLLTNNCVEIVFGAQEYANTFGDKAK